VVAEVVERKGCVLQRQKVEVNVGQRINSLTEHIDNSTSPSSTNLFQARRDRRTKEKKMKVRSINFKWNPFTLKGEAPASMRFLADPNPESEFASKEDLEIINANPQLLKTHKAMLAGVQKKLEGFNTEKKQMQAQLEKLTAQVTELDSGLTEWETWASTNKGLIEKVTSAGSKGGEGSGEEGGKGGKKGGETDTRMEELIQAINRGASQYEERLGKLDRMLKLSMQMNELYRKNPKVDMDKVLDVALKKGHNDLTKAYEDKEAYGEEIFSQEVETRLKPRLEEELAKRNTNVESGSGSIPVTFEMPKELPKSFEDAGARFLQDREKEASKT
jgi:hypothetical protein